MNKESNFSNNEIYVFAVVMISYDHLTDSMGMEPLGVYSSLKKALKCIEELEGCTAPKSHTLKKPFNELTFDVLEFCMDEQPVMLSLLKKRKEQLEKDLDKTIIDLMKKGLLDQLIGEDGNFYYTLTEKGKKSVGAMKLPEYISRMFKDKDD